MPAGVPGLGMPHGTCVEQSSQDLKLVLVFPGASEGLPGRTFGTMAAVQAGGTLLGLRLEEPSLDEVYSHFFQEIANAEA